MKKLILKSMMVLVLLPGATIAGNPDPAPSQSDISFIPRPAKPGKAYTWVEGHWKWVKEFQKYVWINPSWTKIPKKYSWISETWKSIPKQYRTWPWK